MLCPDSQTFEFDVCTQPSLLRPARFEIILCVITWHQICLPLAVLFLHVHTLFIRVVRLLNGHLMYLSTVSFASQDSFIVKKLIFPSFFNVNVAHLIWCWCYIIIFVGDIYCTSVCPGSKMRFLCFYLSSAFYSRGYCTLLSPRRQNVICEYGLYELNVT